MSKRTPLYDLHIENSAKMVDFAGWDMPIQYTTGIMAEHNQCRERAAIFDVSHMGQVVLKGQEVGQKLEALCPQAYATLKDGKARYGFFTNEAGGIMDDLIVSNMGDHFFVVVNAALRDQDIPHMRAHLKEVEVTEILDCALIALQGPAAEVVLAAHCPQAVELKFMEATFADIDGVPCRVSRLGYTGEDGYEISIPEADAERITKLLLSHEDCALAGLGARDSLRLEAGLCLYGNDIDQGTTPIEASLGWAIQKRRKEEGGFPGAKIIQDQLANGAPRTLVGLRPLGRAPARAQVEVLSKEGNKIGHVTSGCFGPTYQGPVAMGYVNTAYAAVGTEVVLIVRGKSNPAEVVALPFIPQNYKR